MKFIKTFNQITKDDVDSCGGKGSSLGEMTKAGFSVPPGFVVVSDGFERFIDETEIRAEIETELHKADHENMETVERASEQIREIIFSKEMPQDIEKEVLSSFEKLDAKWVAVRSSATSEDGKEAAWAGQLDTFLNTKKENLLEMVKKCWASLFTPRAIFYRLEKGLKKSHISVAVVVQKMIQSEISGIAFSVHPVTEDYNQMVIEAGEGLGEAIVSGQITPDTYVVSKKEKELVEKHISEQEKKLVKKEDGGIEWIDINNDQQKLSDEEIFSLGEQVTKLEKHYGFPVDIEWGKEKGKMYILQCRPITTLSK
jgi:pyruvate,water dikinase